MSDKMTSVYSGGLLYEYSLEASGYGIVEIDGNKAKEQKDFSKYASALSKYPIPTGAAGAASTTNSVACPTKDSNWLVDSTLLPAMPEGAKDVSSFFLLFFIFFCARTAYTGQNADNMSSS